MTYRQKAATLRRVARAIEKEWVRQGQPIHTPFYPTNPLAADCCFAAYALIARPVAVIVGGVAAPEATLSGLYLTQFGTDWDARVLWLYVVAHAVAEGRA